MHSKTPKSPPSPPPPSPPPTVTITNNLGYDVDIYDLWDPNAGTSTVSTSNGSTPSGSRPSTPSAPSAMLKYTRLATVPSGATAQQVQTIRSCGTLQAMRTGNIKALANNYYHKFPVAVMAAMPTTLPISGANVFTLTSDMQKGMDESFKFIKYIQANPSSQLAKDFNTALGDSTNQSEAINTFFQGSGSFPQCTFSTWTAVVEWQSQFTNAWQGTYYLYNLGSSSSGNTAITTDATDTSSSSAPALVAKLVIQSTADANTAVLTMADSNGQSTPVVMAPHGTMQEENAGNGDLSVSLTPVWMNISQTSQQNGKTVSSYVIGAAFSGTINGIQVTGNLNKLTMPSPSEISTNPTGTSNQNSANNFSLSSLEGLVGMLTSIGMLYYMAKGHKAAETQNKNDARASATSEADAKAKVSQIEARYQANEVSVVNRHLTHLEINVVPKVEGGYKQMDQALDIQATSRAMKEESKELGEALTDGSNDPALVGVSNGLAAAEGDLQQAVDPNTKAKARNADLNKANEGIKETGVNLTNVLQQEGNAASQQEQEAGKKAAKAEEEEQKEKTSENQAEEKQEEQDQEAPGTKVDGNNEGNAEPEGKNGEVKEGQEVPKVEGGGDGM